MKHTKKINHYYKREKGMQILQHHTIIIIIIKHRSEQKPKQKKPISLYSRAKSTTNTSDKYIKSVGDTETALLCWSFVSVSVPEDPELGSCVALVGMNPVVCGIGINWVTNMSSIETSESWTMGSTRNTNEMSVFTRSGSSAETNDHWLQGFVIGAMTSKTFCEPRFMMAST